VRKIRSGREDMHLGVSPPWSFTKESNPYSGRTTFGVVRSPFGRLVSAVDVDVPETIPRLAIIIVCCERALLLRPTPPGSPPPPLAL